MEYFILKPDGEQSGTFSMEQIRAMLNSGFIGPDTRYWHEGLSDWQPVERIEESVNFPEPDPHVPHTPPPHQWSGSLARAIPSPRQQQRPSGPIPEVSTSAADIPKSALSSETTTPANGASAPTFSREQAVAAAPRPAPRRRIRLPLPSAAQVRTTALLILAAAIIAAIVLSRHPAKSAFSQVHLSPTNACALISQADIRTFENDMHRSPVIAHLKDLIASSTDPAFIQSAKVGLQQQMAQHETNVTHDYVQNGRAQLIEPDTYHTVAYFDDNGGLAVANAKAPWAAIDYKGTIVYVYVGSDFQPCPQ